MKLSAADRDSLIQLLTRLYRDILEIESTHHLVMGEPDLRSRIEYFQDAIRAYSAGDAGGRLSVEYLAYDLKCLRYIQSMPLASVKPMANTDIITVSANLPAKAKKLERPGREIREKLGELYEQYALLFAALLKPQADRDYQDRSEEINQQVEELAPVIHALEALAAGKGNLAHLENLIGHVEDEGAHQLLKYFMEAENYRKKEKILELIKLLKNRIDRQDETLATIENAHMQYGLGQLGIYEEGKDALKAMAAQGMNLAGRFVEASMSEARQAGRGSRGR